MDLPKLILASTSRYRRELLMRLRLPFAVESPLVDEQVLPGETAPDTALRLALAKAQAVAERHPQAVVIGSDQVCELGGAPVGKPGDHAAATQQLQRLSGQSVRFHSAVAVVCVERGFAQAQMATVTVQFRQLSALEIENYLRADAPYDCAGSAKCESLGIALVEAIESDDPTALVGLPLVRTAQMLRLAGLDPLRAPAGSADEQGASASGAASLPGKGP